MQHHHLALAATLLAAAIPAAAQTFPSIDTTPAARPAPIAIANEGGIRNRWTLGGELALPVLPDGFAKAQRDVCVALGYQINEDGTTSNFRVLKQWNSETDGIEPVEGFWAAFVGAGADAVSQWKFTPRSEVGPPQPVFTVATLTWRTRTDSWPNQLRARCQISNLAAWLHRFDPRFDMNDHRFDVAQRQNEDRHQRIAGNPANRQR